MNKTQLSGIKFSNANSPMATNIINMLNSMLKTAPKGSFIMSSALYIQEAFRYLLVVDSTSTPHTFDKTIRGEKTDLLAYIMRTSIYYPQIILKVDTYSFSFQKSKT